MAPLPQPLQSRESPRGPGQQVPRAPSPVLAKAAWSPRHARPSCRERGARRLLQVDVLCGAGVLQVLLVVLQEGAAAETVPAACLSGPPAPPSALPGSACDPQKSLLSCPGHQGLKAPLPPDPLLAKVPAPPHARGRHPPQHLPQVPPTYRFSSDLPSHLCPNSAHPLPGPHALQTWPLGPSPQRGPPCDPTHPTLWATGRIDSWETKTWQANRLSRGCFVMKPK